ncbi:MNIO family bufferin maturase [Prosthecomicrobium sp. N25]|uniref:MNIO family bufferin maturase n=1 Tax=Prosthecomicrobium sp. N25 TaxID=3129254 RepID=UPI00307840C5
MPDATPNARALPARAGIGLKPQYARAVLEDAPDVGFFEIHAENYMGEGGPPHRHLAAIRERYPLSLHGVGLSIGAPGPLDREHLDRLRRLVDLYRPESFSEHLAWSTHDTGYLNDLLPLPYTPATLTTVAEHVAEVQDRLGLRMLLENPSTYLVFAQSTIDEVDFLAEVARRTGCGLLLDVNNVVVSAVNHGLDPFDIVARFPLDLVGEIHLAGYDETVDGAGARLLIDAHGSAVKPDVFRLYEAVLARSGPVPTLVEWDNDVPDLPVLVAEARRAEAAMARAAAPTMRRSA